MSTVPCFTSGQNNTGISQSWIGVCSSDVYWAPAMGTILYQAHYMYASLSQMPVSGSSDCLCCGQIDSGRLNKVECTHEKIIGPRMKSWGIHLKRERKTSLVAQVVKNLPAKQETPVWSQGQEDPLEKGMTTHYRILAWKIPGTEEPGGL